MQQQQGECCRGELCQCSINAHLNLREFGGIATSITSHQNTFQSAQSTMSNACHWFLRPLSRGKHVQVSRRQLHLTGLVSNVRMLCTSHRGRRSPDLSRSLAPLQRAPVMNALLTGDLFDQTWVPAVRSKPLTHLSPQSVQAQLHCYREHRH